MTAERVRSLGPLVLDANLMAAESFEADRPAGERGCYKWLDFYNNEDRPFWIKHIRVYEHCPRLMDPDALAILGDALELGNRASVDEVIRDVGIAGCWRPSTVLVQRITSYADDRLLVDNATIAHALWNVDFHAVSQRSFQYRIELFNDEPRPRKVRVGITTVQLTDAELRGDPDLPRDRLTKLENKVETLRRETKALTLDLAREVGARMRKMAGED